MVIADIETDLIEYADFEEVASVARAKSFITAATRWLILRPESASNQSSSLSIGKDKIESLLKRARDFVAANPATNGSGGGSVRFLGAGTNFR
jgi:hypothetical protein